MQISLGLGQCTPHHVACHPISWFLLFWYQPRTKVSIYLWPPHTPSCPGSFKTQILSGIDALSPKHLTSSQELVESQQGARVEHRPMWGVQVTQREEGANPVPTQSWRTNVCPENLQIWCWGPETWVAFTRERSESMTHTHISVKR